MKIRSDDLRKKTLTKMSMDYRGKILHDFAYMDSIIGIYISRFFCGNNEPKNEAMHLLLFGDDRISFKGKMDVFCFIASTYDQAWYKSYKGIRSTLKKDLEHAMEQRNVFAHQMIDLESDKKNEITFLKFKNSISPTVYDAVSVKKLQDMLNDIGKFIYQRIIHETPPSLDPGPA